MSNSSKQTRRRYLAAVGATGIAASLSGCLAGQGTGTTAGEGGGGGISGQIPMGSIMPISGALSAFGPGMEKSVQLAVKDINNAGGVRGADIKLFPRDSETKPQKAVQKYNSLVSSENIVGFVGAASSGVSTTIAKNVASDGVMEVSHASTSPVLAKIGNKTVEGEQVKFFGRTSPNDGQQGIVMAKVMSDYIKADSAAFLHVANAYGKGLAEKAKAAFGGETLQLVPYSKKSQDYTSVLNKLHEGEPDAIGFVGYPANGRTIMKQWNNGSYGTTASDWVSSEGIKSDKLLSDLNDIMAGMYFTSPNPKQTGGASTFKQKIGESNTLFAAHAYDGMVLQALAMVKANEASGLAIAKNIRAVSRPPGTKFTVGEYKQAATALEDGKEVNYQGASSPVDLNKNLEPLNAYTIQQVRDDGSLKTLEKIPRDFFEGKL